MAYHALEYDKSYENDHGKYYTSILTDKLIYQYPSKDFHEFQEHNDAFYMLRKTEHPRYDSIRDNERFIAVVKTLEKTAK